MRSVLPMLGSRRAKTALLLIPSDSEPVLAVPCRECHGGGIRSRWPTVRFPVIQNEGEVAFTIGSPLRTVTFEVRSFSLYSTIRSRGSGASRRTTASQRVTRAPTPSGAVR